VRESRLPGSAWGVRSNPHPYYDHKRSMFCAAHMAEVSVFRSWPFMF